jgi:HEPN domain-containing protein
MRPEVTEWISYAERDLITAKREFPQEDQPNYEAVCFHSQQCVEKYLKGYLTNLDVSFPKTHDLVKLVRLCLPYVPGWADWERRLYQLDSYALEARYPGDRTTKEEAEDALGLSEEFRLLVRSELGL